MVSPELKHKKPVLRKAIIFSMCCIFIVGCCGSSETHGNSPLSKPLIVGDNCVGKETTHVDMEVGKSRREVMPNAKTDSEVMAVMQRAAGGKLAMQIADRLNVGPSEVAVSFVIPKKDAQELLMNLPESFDSYTGVAHVRINNELLYEARVYEGRLAHLTKITQAGDQGQ